ncbi:MAG: GDP-L-fucose synthase [Bacteroidetes bacterium]|nr:GDP-L-fucose synthase [Bacteroidota bacterium]
MDKQSKIYIAGHTGMVGSAILRKLEMEGYSNFVLEDSKALDLRDQSAVNSFFEENKPEYIFMAAAKVGGILANDSFGADFIYDNLMIESNIIHNAHIHEAKKLLFLGSSCIYPRLADQPMKEEYILTAPLEKTNEAYAVAKIAGIKLCEYYNRQYGSNFISVMPTNLYGPNDNYDLQNAHVIPAMIRKFHEAKVDGNRTVEIWGTGKPMREFMHVDDLADACYHLMLNYNDSSIINIGTGEEISIADLARMIKEEVDFDGDLEFNSSRPDGTPRKLLDVSKLSEAGWQFKISLREGLKSVYAGWIEDNVTT